MKREYDFSKGVRGRFCRRRVKLNLPVYLDEEVFLFVQDIAGKRKADASTVVNQLLRSNMELARNIK